MPVKDYVVSVIRTIVPLIVGALIVFFADLGIEIDSEALSIVVNGLLIGIYYAVVRAIESRFPWIGVLLGWKAAPEYKSNNAS